MFILTSFRGEKCLLSLILTMPDQTPLVLVGNFVPEGGKMVNGKLE